MVGPFPRKLAAQKNSKILVQFRTTSWLDCEYLRNATRHRQSENGVANHRHSCTGKLNLVYFDPQMVKNRTRVLTHPTGGHQAGHCHTSSCTCVHSVDYILCSSSMSVCLLQKVWIPVQQTAEQRTCQVLSCLPVRSRRSSRIIPLATISVSHGSIRPGSWTVMVIGYPSGVVVTCVLADSTR